MSWFTNLKVSTKLMLGFLVLIGLLMAAGVTGYAGVQAVAQAGSQVEEAAAQAGGLLVLVTGAGVAVGLLLAWSISRQISWPLSRIVRGAELLSEGDVEVTGIDRKEIARINARSDEMGAIGRAFSQLIEYLTEMATVAQHVARGDLTATPRPRGAADLLGNAVATMKSNVETLVGDMNELSAAAVSGRLDARSDPTAHEGEFRTIVDGINRTLDTVIDPIEEAARVLEKVAARDLTPRITGDYSGDHGRTKRALNGALETLDRTLSQVLQNAAQLDSASGQISSGSQALAQSASEQASSLEEVSSSLEEIGSMTQQNASNSQEARGLAEQSSSAAERGSEAMFRMIEAIEKIKGSSDETAKIVSTIDEIAFQTNLLALNAAVEAARAGEAGKGFAVVAEEVRTLAQRSAEAARNTADLIEGSVRNAEAGVSVTEEVAAALGEINDAAQKTRDLVAEIATASGEQAQGLAQVNTGVEQLNNVTQQTAANTEESASAAEELAGQAAELRSLLAQFQLGDGRGSRPSAVSGGAGGRTRAKADGANGRRGANGKRGARSVEDDAVLAEF